MWNWIKGFLAGVVTLLATASTYAVYHQQTVVNASKEEQKRARKLHDRSKHAYDVLTHALEMIRNGADADAVTRYIDLENSIQKTNVKINKKEM